MQLDCLQATIIVGFRDTTENQVNTSTGSHAYPDHGANLSAPSITASPTLNTTITCSAGTWRDTDQDPENTTARTFTWFINGVNYTSKFNTTILYPSDFDINDEIICQQDSYAQDWSIISRNSTNSSTETVGMSCGNLTTSNIQYNLSADIVTHEGACFNITADNITLSCASNTMTGINTSSSTAINISANNASVINCTMHSFDVGITINGTALNAYYNNITTSIWINDTGSGNNLNTTDAGNIYYLADGSKSWDKYQIYNNGSSNWATSGPDRPFNSSNVAEWFGEFLEIMLQSWA